MPETLDFEKIASKLLEAWNPSDPAVTHAAITETIRLAWNARGAADIATIENDLPAVMGDAAGPHVKTLDRALRTLDR